jgi:uncharacterized alkaline shock family protein YloU
MVTIENHIGKITVSESYLSELVRHTVSRCFGVTDVSESNPIRNAAFALSGGKLCRCHKGVQIHCDKDKGIFIDLHIKVTYGTNISAAVKSITHKVSFTVEEALGLPVNRVRVFVDGMSY